jgi:flagellin
MSLGVLNNISAVYAENNLNNTNNSLSNVLQQLSSGSKINSGADDAAGLSLVNGLQANQQALNQSQTNATEGVGLLQVADGALSQVTSLLNRAVTLATEASNGTLNSTQDLAANQEYQSILSEVSNIGSTTTYNQEQVFNSKTNIYTGDSSTQGASVAALNIRTLSASNLGDTSGTMAYSNGTNNVFLDLSTTGKNAAVTDTLGATTATTTVAVSYLTKGAGGSAVTASANINVGAGTNYANTAQGLISAINNSGLGLTASFGTAAQAGAGATSTATTANDTNSALETGSTDTGIIISGAGVGVNSTGTNGAGEVGTLTVASSTDALSGTLTVVGLDGASHAITLGTPNSTDTLANLASTINAAGYGVTATVNTTAQTIQNGVSQAKGTVLTFASADSAATVNTTSATDVQAAQTSITFTSLAGSQLATTAVGVLTDAGTATDTLTGILDLTNGAGGGAAVVTQLNLGGGTLQSLFNSTNGTAITALTAANLSVAVTTNNNGQSVATFSTIAVAGAGSHNTGIAIDANSAVEESAAATGAPVVQQGTTVITNGTASATTLGTITVTNANDTFSGGTIVIDKALTAGANQTETLGTAGSTDNLVDLAKTINANATADGISATLNSAGTVLTLATNATDTVAAGTDVALTSTGVTSTLALSGTPTAAGTANSTVLGTLALPTNEAQTGASGDKLGGTLTFGTESITLGTTTGSAKTDTMADLAATINAGTYGVTATLNSAGTAITFTSANSDNATTSTVLPTTVAAVGGQSTSSTSSPYIAAAYDWTISNTDANTDANLTFTKANNAVTSSAYYSVGVSGTVADTSTGGGTGTVGLSNDMNGSGGVATISYSDAAGQSLSQTDLTNAADAQSALTDLNTAISDVAAQDGYIGAMINTLNSVSQVLSTQQENVQSAQNAVQATDYASATSNMSKYEILSQTGISALAQANSMQQEVTKLLQ